MADERRKASNRQSRWSGYYSLTGEYSLEEYDAGMEQIFAKDQLTCPSVRSLSAASNISFTYIIYDYTYAKREGEKQRETERDRERQRFLTDHTCELSLNM